MSDNIISSSQKAVEDMLFYYYYSLVRSKCPDPKQVIATELPKMINLTEDQMNYIKINCLQENKLLENLDSSIGLLSSMEGSKVLDMESIRIVKGILTVMKEQCKQTFDDFILESISQSTSDE
jgi:uncharacterized protein YeeX (DUF496 family)